MSVRSTSRLFRFGLFEADLANATLSRKGIRIRLQEQPFRILAMLLERAGQVVTREELRQELWPAGTYVDFDGSLNAALKRLRTALADDADNPRFIETMPKRGYRFIAPVTAQNPLQDVRTEVPFNISLQGTRDDLLSSGQGSSTAISRGHWMRPAAAGGLIIISLVAFFILRERRAVLPMSIAQPNGNVDLGAIRRSVAVLGFQNASGHSSDGWLSTALAEMLRTELGAGGKLRVIPGEDISQFRVDSPWPLTDSLSRQTASRIGKALGSDLLVLGSFAALPDLQNGAIRVDFRLQDAQTGAILYEGAESGTEGQFFGLVAKIGVALRERLDLPEISESDEVGVLSSLPSNPDANRLYSLGLAKLRDADVAAAKDLFLQAEKLAPRFPLVHLMLSRAWGGLGYDQKAKDEGKLAYQLSSGLPEVDKLQVEAAYFGNTGDRERAISACRALYSLYPDSVDYGEQLIAALNSAGRPEEALRIVTQLRNLPEPLSQDPRIDFWQAQLVSDTQGDAQPFFERAVAGAASRGERLLYARFRLDQCINLVYGDHPEGATEHCKEAYDIFMSADNTLYAADALRTIADRRGSEGDLTGARELYEQALALLTKLGEHEKTGVVLNNMAITYENQGQIDEAEKLFRRAAQTWTECGDTVNVAAALGNLGDVSMLRGQLMEAEKQYTTALKITESMGSNYFAYDLYSIAAIRLYEGDISSANRYATEALAMSQARHQTADTPSSLETLGAIRIAQADFAGARSYFEQARKIQMQLGKKGAVAENDASLGTVSIEEGNFSAAESALRESLAEFKANKYVSDEVSAETDLARVLLREGKLFDARQMISDALALSASSGDPNEKLPVAIQDARIQAVEITDRAKIDKSRIDLSMPRRKLQNALATAHRLRYYGIECDARLALGEIEIHENPTVARAHLAELANEARQHGMNLVSRRASELSTSGSASASKRPT